MEEGVVTFDEIKLLAKDQICTPKEVAEAAKEIRESREAKGQAHEAEIYYTGKKPAHGLREMCADRHRQGIFPGDCADTGIDASSGYFVQLGEDFVY